MLLPALLTWLYFVALAGSGHTLIQQLCYVLNKAVQVGLPVVFVTWTDRRVPWPERPRFDGLALGLGFGVLVAAAMFGLYFGWLRDTAVFGSTPEQVRGKLDELGVTTPGRFLLLAVFIVVPHSLLEEYFWRWFVFGQLRKGLPFVPAVVLSNLAFMAHHVIVLDHYFPNRFWTAALPFSIGVAAGGAVWAWLYERTGSIYAPWLSHLIIDAAVFVLGWDLVQRAGSG
jgi:membrane protease YdiL (CAAX protease family)